MITIIIYSEYIFKATGPKYKHKKMPLFYPQVVDSFPRLLIFFPISYHLISTVISLSLHYSYDSRQFRGKNKKIIIILMDQKHRRKKEKMLIISSARCLQNLFQKVVNLLSMLKGKGEEMHLIESLVQQQTV